MHVHRPRKTTNQHPRKAGAAAMPQTEEEEEEERLRCKESFLDSEEEATSPPVPFPCSSSTSKESFSSQDTNEPTQLDATLAVVVPHEDIQELDILIGHDGTDHTEKQLFNALTKPYLSEYADEEGDDLMLDFCRDLYADVVGEGGRFLQRQQTNDAAEGLAWIQLEKQPAVDAMFTSFQRHRRKAALKNKVPDPDDGGKKERAVIQMKDLKERDVLTGKMKNGENDLNIVVTKRYLNGYQQASDQKRFCRNLYSDIVGQGGRFFGTRPDTNGALIELDMETAAAKMKKSFQEHDRKDKERMQQEQTQTSLATTSRTTTMRCPVNEIDAKDVVFGLNGSWSKTDPKSLYNQIISIHIEDFKATSAKRAFCRGLLCRLQGEGAKFWQCEKSNDTGGLVWAMPTTDMEVLVRKLCKSFTQLAGKQKNNHGSLGSADVPSSTDDDDSEGTQRNVDPSPAPVATVLPGEDAGSTATTTRVAKRRHEFASVDDAGSSAIKRHRATSPDDDKYLPRASHATTVPKPDEVQANKKLLDLDDKIVREGGSGQIEWMALAHEAMNVAKDMMIKYSDSTQIHANALCLLCRVLGFAERQNLYGVKKSAALYCSSNVIESMKKYQGNAYCLMNGFEFLTLIWDEAPSDVADQTRDLILLAKTGLDTDWNDEKDGFDVVHRASEFLWKVAGTESGRHSLIEDGVETSVLCRWRKTRDADNTKGLTSLYALFARIMQAEHAKVHGDVLSDTVPPFYENEQP